MTAFLKKIKTPLKSHLQKNKMDMDKHFSTSSDSDTESSSDNEKTLENKAWIRTADALFKVCRKRKRLDKKYKSLSKELKERSDSQTTKRGRYEYRLIIRKGGIKYDQIPELNGVDLEVHRKEEIKSWKLEVII